MMRQTKAKATVSFLLATAALVTVWFSTQRAVAGPTLVLPEDAVYMKSWRTGESYWWTYLYDFPPGEYDVGEGYYIGWCVDEGHYINPGREYYPVTLYSSYDPNMPAYFQDPDWDKVNYIVNNKQGAWDDVQEAIWHFINGSIGGLYGGTDPDVWAMINAANANGEGFEPGCGQSIAVLCDAGEGIQHTFIEVNQPVPEASTLLLFGSGASGLLFYIRRKRPLRT